MTVSIGGIPGSGGSYYTGSSYYKEGEVKSQWGGGAKEVLRLRDGAVHAEQLDMLFDGHVPDGNRVAKIKDGKWVSDSGRDFTFSADKSVSILAQGPQREAILASVMRSADKAMQYGEKEFAATRITNRETGKREVIGNQKIVYGLFREETSRMDDPAVHAHAPMPSLAFGADGKFRALFNQNFYNNHILLGQVFRSELAKDLKAMGYQIKKTGKHGQFEVKGVDAKVRQTFSKRREAMLEKAGADHEDPAKMSRINLLTRPNKSNLSRDALLPKWEAELKSLGTSFKEVSAKALAQEKTKIPDLRSVVISTIKDKSETQRSFGKYQVLKAVMGETYGHFTIDQVQSELDHQTEKGFIKQSKDGKHYALSKTLEREKRVIEHMHTGHLQAKPFMPKQTAMEKITDKGLTGGQINGAALILSSHDRATGIQGTAGVGKTTMLKTALPVVKEHGFELVGIAPTHKAVGELKDTGQFDKTMTLQQYLIAPRGGRNTVLVVDESSMMGTDQMLSLLSYANSKKLAKVVLMGDTGQMGAVAAGTPFKDMQNSGLRTAHIDQVVRQKNPRHREAIQHLSNENIITGFKRLAPEIHETTSGKLEMDAASRWHTLKDPKAPIIVQTNRQKDEINTAIKSKLKLGDDSPELSHNILKAHHLTEEKKKFVASYEGATHIRFNRDYKNLGVKKGDILKIKSLHEDKAHITLKKGSKTLKFHPAKDAVGKSSTQAFREEKVSLGQGDRVRFTQSLKPKKISNNDFGFIKSVKDGKITIKLDKGREISMEASSSNARFIDHAWANTAHAFQGTTVDHAIVVMPSKKSPLTTLNSLYTGASRHRLSVAIITDDKNRLQQNLRSALQVEKMKDKLFRDEKSNPQKVNDPTERSLERVKTADHANDKSVQRKAPARDDFGR